MEIDEAKIEAFQDRLFSWWTDNKREFPWRKTEDPYHILVAEVMLQQTQASRVEEKYRKFTTRFPTIECLTEADVGEVIKLWSGLGYNRRAVWLHEAANQLVETEEFPRSLSELEELKGVGPYTARAILIFAFNKNIATVDTNIRRVLIAEGFAKEATSKEQLFEIAQELLPEGRAREWHNALMDYGSLVLTSSETGISPTSSQGTFEGSTRDYRGRVVKYLTQHSAGDREQIIEQCGIPAKEADKVFRSLVADGLIKKEEERFTLP